MKRTNQIVIGVLIVVADNEFYVISVNVSISCQISKTFKHRDSDKFYVGNSRQKGNKMKGAFIIALLCMIEYIPDKRELSFLTGRWWEQNPLFRISHTWCGGIPHQLASGSIRFTPYFSFSLLLLPVLGSVEHVCSGLHTTSGGPSWHNVEGICTGGSSAAFATPWQLTISEFHREVTKHHVNTGTSH